MSKSIITVTAEVGINANASIETALSLMDMAKLCGCDAVKFQKRTVEKVYTKEFLDSPRQSPWGTTQREQKMALEFSRSQYDQIDCYSKKIGLPWYASAWDIESLEFLDKYDLPYQKIASPMALDIEFVQSVIERKKHTFISTGKIDEAGLNTIVNMFRLEKVPFTLLHCVNKYPQTDSDCYLYKIGELKKRYKCPVGYSNHHPSRIPSILAVAWGAEALETHICLDRTSYGTDMPASMEFTTLYHVVRDARRIKEIWG